MLGSHVPELRALELLVTLARTSSISAAAAELGVTQQAASSRLRNLEAVIGAPLVARTRLGSELTATGELVVQWATPVLDAAERLGTAVTALRGGRRSQLRIAASLTIAEYLLPGWLVLLRSHQQSRGLGEAKIAMTAANSERVATLVREGAVDLGFVEGPTPPQDLGHRVVAVDELVVIVGPSHPWAQRRERQVRAATLAATALITREAGSGTRTVLEKALHGHKLALPALELSTTAAVKAAVASGAAPAAVSAFAVRDDIAAGRLVAVRAIGVELSRRLLAVWRGGSAPPAGPARDLLHLTVSPQPR